MNELIEVLDREFRSKDIGWSLGSLGTDHYALELVAWNTKYLPIMRIEGPTPETLASIAVRYVGLLNDSEMRQSYGKMSDVMPGLILKYISIEVLAEQMRLSWYDQTGKTKQRALWKLTTEASEFVSLETYEDEVKQKFAIDQIEALVKELKERHDS